FRRVLFRSESRIAVRKMYIATARTLPSMLAARQVGQKATGQRIQPQTRKAGAAHRPGKESRGRIRADTEYAAAERHVEPVCLRVDPGDLEQVVLVGHAGEPRFLLGLSEPFEVVGLLRILQAQ